MFSSLTPVADIVFSFSSSETSVRAKTDENPDVILPFSSDSFGSCYNAGPPELQLPALRRFVNSTLSDSYFFCSIRKLFKNSPNQTVKCRLSKSGECGSRVLENGNGGCFVLSRYRLASCDATQNGYR